MTQRLITGRSGQVELFQFMMSRFRTYIVYLFSFLLVSGLMMSTLHIHEVRDLDRSTTPDYAQTIQQDHLFCPFCSVVFEGVTVETQHPELPLLLREELPLFDVQIVTSFHYAANSGRSPPTG